MFGRFFDTSEIDTLAHWIAAELAKSLPPAEAVAPGRKAQEKVARLDQQVARRVAELAARGGLNFYKKARLGSSVKQALDEAGYPAEFSQRYIVDLVSLAAVADSRKP